MLVNIDIFSGKNCRINTHKETICGWCLCWNHVGKMLETMLVSSASCALHVNSEQCAVSMSRSTSRHSQWSHMESKWQWGSGRWSSRWWDRKCESSVTPLKDVTNSRVVGGLDGDVRHQLMAQPMVQVLVQIMVILMEKLLVHRLGN